MKALNNFLFLFLLLFFLSAPRVLAFDVPDQLTLKTDFRIWEINPTQLGLVSEGLINTSTTFMGMPVVLKPEETQTVSSYLTQSEVQHVDSPAIREYLINSIAPAIDRESTSVSIDMNEDGVITFDGSGHYGRQLDVEAATHMLQYALENNIEFINLPLVTQDPEVTVNSEKLKEMGINGFVSSGETNFGGSPGNRVHNITTGLSSFQGILVAPGEEFSFGDTIGHIDGSTGYLPELVIKGDKTVPEYGGGLCQVSTTAYRAVLAAGYPVKQRQNHSYMVSYYAPLGLDATFYEGGWDMVFVNDTPDHLLMQTFIEGSTAYYNFYGTKPDRQVRMIGPYYSNWRSAPAARVEYSPDMPPGEEQVVGHAVNGLDVMWYRHVTYRDQNVIDEETGKEKPKTFLETISSKYEARPSYVIVGGPDPSTIPEVTENEEVEGEAIVSDSDTEVPFEAEDTAQEPTLGDIEE